jgi:hypothetical protein
MAYEITNRLRNSTVIRVDGAGTTTLALANLSSNASIETVNSATIKRVAWSTNGSITIARGGVNVLTLFGSGEMRFDDYAYALANNNTGNIVITVASGGSAIIDLSKDATYSPALTGI